MFKYFNLLITFVSLGDENDQNLDIADAGCV